MELKLGDVQTTALIPLAVKANETLRKNARIKAQKAVEIIKTLNIDTEKYDKFMSHEGVVARTIMLDRQLYEKIRLHSRRRIFYGVVCIKWTLDHFLILNAPIPG